MLLAVGALLVVLSLALIGVDDLRGEQSSGAGAAEPAFDAFAGGFPVPPLPGQHLDVRRGPAALAARTGPLGRGRRGPRDRAAEPECRRRKEDPRD